MKMCPLLSITGVFKLCSFKLCQFRQNLYSKPEKASHPFPVEKYGLGLRGPDSNPGKCRLGCKQPQYMCKV